MKKVIAVVFLLFPFNSYAKDLTVYVDGVPILSNAYYLFTETVFPGHGVGKSTSWGVDLTYSLDSEQALSFGYYSDGVGLESAVSDNPAYTFSYKRFLSEVGLDSRYFFRLGILYSKGLLWSFGSSEPGAYSDANLNKDYMPILTYGKEIFYSDNFSVSGEIGPGYLSLLIGYRF